jgi:hypothetical protein
MPSVVTPFPNLIYEDDFSIRAGWVIEETDGFGMYYQAGGYRIDNRSSSSNVSSTRSFEHPDIRVEVDAIRVRWSLGGYYGVVCRWQNFQNMYAFVIGGDGFHAIAKIQQGEVSFLREGQMQNGSIQFRRRGKPYQRDLSGEPTGPGGQRAEIAGNGRFYL